jgi:hypothetical protein
MLSATLAGIAWTVWQIAHGLDCPVFEFCWEQKALLSSHRLTAALGTTLPPIQSVPVFLPRG